MKVTLVWDVAEGGPGDTVEVTDSRGRQLLRDGHARLNKPAPFNPSEHNVPKVLAYLDSAPPEERDRVLSAEVSGRNRAGIVNR